MKLHNPYLSGSIYSHGVVRVTGSTYISGGLDVDGNVGIGTVSPSASLHIDDYYGGNSIRQFQMKHLVMQDLNAKNTIIGMNAYYNGIGGEMTPIDTGGFVWLQMYQNGFRFKGGTGNGGESTVDQVIMHIDNSDANRGNVGIGTTTPSEILDVNGNGRIRSIGSGTSAGALHYEADGTLTTNTSDRRLKKNINYISGSEYLGRVLGLEPVTFKWKGSSKEERDGQEITLKEQQISGSFISGSVLSSVREEVKELRKVNRKRRENRERLQYGFIAQDVRDTIPELVGRQDDGMLFLRSEQMDSLLVLALKEQQNIIQDLKARIEKLEKQ